MLNRLLSVVFIVINVITITASASAGTVASDVEFTKCINNTDGATFDAIDCIGAATKRADARLNVMYKQLMAKLEPDQQTKLKTAQRAWITWRDTNCGFYADPFGGSEARIAGNDCFRAITTSRADELTALNESY